MIGSRRRGGRILDAPSCAIAFACVSLPSGKSYQSGNPVKCHTPWWDLAGLRTALYAISHVSTTRQFEPESCTSVRGEVLLVGPLRDVAPLSIACAACVSRGSWRSARSASSRPVFASVGPSCRVWVGFSLGGGSLFRVLFVFMQRWRLQISRSVAADARRSSPSGRLGAPCVAFALRQVHA